jgi:hypothetical protein
MRYQIGLLLLLLAVSMGGCGTELSRAELGTVLFEVPKVAGADEPYQMPQLGPPLPEEEEHGHRPLP